MEVVDKMENVLKDLEKVKVVDLGLFMFGMVWVIGLFLRDLSGLNFVVVVCDLLGFFISYLMFLYRCCLLLFFICMIWNFSFLEVMILF